MNALEKYAAKRHLVEKLKKEAWVGTASKVIGGLGKAYRASKAVAQQAKGGVGGGLKALATGVRSGRTNAANPIKGHTTGSGARFQNFFRPRVRPGTDSFAGLHKATNPMFQNSSGPASKPLLSRASMYQRGHMMGQRTGQAQRVAKNNPVRTGLALGTPAGLGGGYAASKALFPTKDY